VVREKHDLYQVPGLGERGIGFKGIGYRGMEAKNE